MLCLAPLILVGYAVGLQTAAHEVKNLNNGQVLEIQTCERGLGMDAKVSTFGLYGVGLQYGLGVYTGSSWTVTLLPKAGLSYSSEDRRELPMRGQFEVGGQFLIGYQHWRAGVEYWHLSNAGLQAPNIGLDMLIVQTGWSF